MQNFRQILIIFRQGKVKGASGDIVLFVFLNLYYETPKMCYQIDFYISFICNVNNNLIVSLNLKKDEDKTNFFMFFCWLRCSCLRMPFGLRLP